MHLSSPVRNPDHLRCNVSNLLRGVPNCAVFSERLTMILFLGNGFKHEAEVLQICQYFLNAEAKQGLVCQTPALPACLNSPRASPGLHPGLLKGNF